jgi:hypothetical protein
MTNHVSNANPNLTCPSASEEGGDFAPAMTDHTTLRTGLQKQTSSAVLPAPQGRWEIEVIESQKKLGVLCYLAGAPKKL